MSDKPTCRELLDAIRKHEEFLNDLEWSREDDCLVFMLAARVERVLRLQPMGWAGYDTCLALVKDLLDGGMVHGDEP